MAKRLYQEHMHINGVNSFLKKGIKLGLTEDMDVLTTKSDENVERVRTLIQNDEWLKIIITGMEVVFFSMTLRKVAEHAMEISRLTPL
jgi:hypothetical protein